MSDWQQYEIWAQKKGQWGMVASFREFDVASAVLRNYTYRTRLVRVFYKDAEPVEKEVIVELGETREKP